MVVSTYLVSSVNSTHVLVVEDDGVGTTDINT